MRVEEKPEYKEDRSRQDPKILIQLDKKIKSIIEHKRPLGHPFKYVKGVWEGYIGKYRLYYQMSPDRLILLRFLHKDFQKKLRF